MGCSTINAYEPQIFVYDQSQEVLTNNSFTLFNLKLWANQQLA